MLTVLRVVKTWLHQDAFLGYNHIMHVVFPSREQVSTD